jgi:hypothetical protein
MSSGRSFVGRGEIIRRRWALLAGSVGFSLVAIALMVFHAPMWGPLVEEGLAMVLMVAWLSNTYPARRAGELRADATGIAFDRKLLVARDRIASAYQLSVAEPAVRIMKKGGVGAVPFDVRLQEERTEELLDALGLGIGQSIASFNAVAGSRPWLPVLVWMAVIAASFVTAMEGLLHHLPMVVAGSFALLSFVLVALVLGTKMSVDVGSDGVLLRRPFRHRFLRYGALAGVTSDRFAIALQLRSGETIRFSLGVSASQVASRDSLAARIEEARLACAQERPSGDAEGFVAPGGRPLRRWVSEVRALARARDYREARVEAERLWRVLDDATTSPATRAGAAIALSADEGTRARLRVAADACAEPRLRVALTRVAEGATDPELEEALAPLLEAEE